MYTSHLERLQPVAGTYHGQPFTGKLIYKSAPIYNRATERLYWDLTIQLDRPIDGQRKIDMTVNNFGTLNGAYRLNLAYTESLLRTAKAERQRNYAIKLLWEYRAQTLDQLEVMQELNLTRTHTELYDQLYSIASECAQLAWFIDSLPASITEVE